MGWPTSRSVTSNTFLINTQNNRLCSLSERTGKQIIKALKHEIHLSSGFTGRFCIAVAQITGFFAVDEIISVYYKNHMQHTNTPCRQTQSFFVLKVAVYTETAVCQAVTVLVGAVESISIAHCFMQRLSGKLDLLRCMTYVLPATTTSYNQGLNCFICTFPHRWIISLIPHPALLYMYVGGRVCLPYNRRNPRYWSSARK